MNYQIKALQYKQKWFRKYCRLYCALATLIMMNAVQMTTATVLQSNSINFYVELNNLPINLQQIWQLHYNHIQWTTVSN